MDKFQIFSSNLGSVRTLFNREDGEVWFFGNDVAEALGYKATRNALAKHTSPSDRKPLNYADCTESVQSELWQGNDRKDKIFINESGLYCLIFGSKLEKAEEFKLWVTKEVLPSIRKNGAYILGQDEMSTETQEELFETIRAFKAKLVGMSDYANTWEEMYDRLMRDYRELAKQMFSTPEEDVPKPKKTGRVFVSKEGWVMSEELLRLLGGENYES